MSWKLAQNNEISEVRKAYGQTLEKMILEGRPVMVCDADLAGSSGAGYLYDKYPEHTVNFGICEANMVADVTHRYTPLRPFLCTLCIQTSCGSGMYLCRICQAGSSYLCIGSRLLVVVQWGNTYHL